MVLLRPLLQPLLLFLLLSFRYPPTVGLTSIHHGDQAILLVSGAADATGPANCVPFGTGDWGPWKGFIYAAVPAFTLSLNDRIAFDLGAENSHEITMDVGIAATTTSGGVVPDDDGFTSVCSACTPLSPFGNAVIGDHELEFQANVPGATYVHRAGDGVSQSLRTDWVGRACLRRPIIIIDRPTDRLTYVLTDRTAGRALPRYWLLRIGLLVQQHSHGVRGGRRLGALRGALLLGWERQRALDGPGWDQREFVLSIIANLPFCHSALFLPKGHI